MNRLVRRSFCEGRRRLLFSLATGLAAALLVNLGVASATAAGSARRVPAQTIANRIDSARVRSTTLHRLGPRPGAQSQNIRCTLYVSQYPALVGQVQRC